jgi:4-amino-4-deoxychorismate lyase
MPKSSDVPGTTGVFETLAVIDGRPRLLERHLARLFEGCRRLNMRAPPESVLTAKICEQAAAPGSSVVKLIVGPGAGEDPGSPSWTVRAEPPRRRPLEWSRDGVRIITCRTRLAMDPRLAGLKVLDRSAQALARSEWTADSIAEGLMLDSDGRLISGTMTNVYAVIDEVVCTPAIVRCGVAGVMRGALLEEWHAGGQSTAIRDLDPGELKSASEIFLSNALIGVWPVSALDCQSFSVGPVATAAAEWVRRIVKAPQAPPSGIP